MPVTSLFSSNIESWEKDGRREERGLFMSRRNGRTNLYPQCVIYLNFEKK